jgi:LPS O-antigen subunit length determinant protein (WzzB/FepE family)
MNFMLAVMEAVTRCVQNGSEQQLADTATTALDVGIEQSVYNTWLKSINTATASVQKWAEYLTTGNYPNGMSKTQCQNALTKAQATLQNKQTQEQTSTQQADSGVQAAQNQAGYDSSIMQLRAQLEAAINQVASMLSSILGQRY